MVKTLAQFIGTRLPGRIAKLNAVLLAIEEHGPVSVRVLEKNSIFQG
jgi:hypothetical protein